MKNIKQSQTISFVIGIDEVGRGALAGPVMVGAAALVVDKKILFPRALGKLKDSKKLSPGQRELWLQYFKKCPDIVFKTARVYPRGIERLNISKAANVAAEKALFALLKILKQNISFKCSGLFG